MKLVLYREDKHLILNRSEVLHYRFPSDHRNDNVNITNVLQKLPPRSQLPSPGIDISNCFARFFSSVFNQPYYCNAVPSIENINMHSVDFNKCVSTLNDIFGELNCISTKTW
jgi:hypothetical protein